MCSRPCTLRRTRPAPSSTRMCLEVELSEIGKALAMSVTRASDWARRARMARRVASETAEKTRSREAAGYSPMGGNIGARRPGSHPARANDVGLRWLHSQQGGLPHCVSLAWCDRVDGRQLGRARVVRHNRSEGLAARHAQDSGGSFMRMRFGIFLAPFHA